MMHEGGGGSFAGYGQPPESMGTAGEVPGEGSSDAAVRPGPPVPDVESLILPLTKEEAEYGVGDDGFPNPGQFRPERRDAA